MFRLGKLVTMFTCKFGLVSQDIGPVLRARTVKINAPAASHADLKSPADAVQAE